MNAAIQPDLEKWTWVGLWGRLQTRKLRSKDLDALFWRVFLPLMIPSGISGFFIDAECAMWDSGERMGLTFVAPLLLLPLGLLSYCTARSSGVPGKMWAVFAPVIGAVIVSLSTVGYFGWINTLSGPVEPVQVSGPIIEKKKGMGTRFSGYNYVVTVRFEDRPVCLNVSKGEYDAVPLGAVYGREMRRGGFGYFYQWKRRSS